MRQADQFLIAIYGNMASIVVWCCERIAIKPNQIEPPQSMPNNPCFSTTLPILLILKHHLVELGKGCITSLRANFYSFPFVVTTTKKFYTISGVNSSITSNILDLK